MHAEPLTLLTNQLYFATMQYLEVVVMATRIFLFSHFFKNCENNEEIISYNHKIFNFQNI